MEIVFIALIALILLISIVTLMIVLKKSSGSSPMEGELNFKLQSLTGDIVRIESAVKSEIAVNRKESSEAAKEDREELSKSIHSFGELISSSIKETSRLQKEQLELFSFNLNNLKDGMESKLSQLTTVIEGKLNGFAESSTSNSRESRQELNTALDNFQLNFSKQIESYGAAQRNSFIDLQSKQSEQNKMTSERLDQMRFVLDQKFTALQKGNEEKLEFMRNTLEKKIELMQTGNEKKLEEMRVTVDEKLEKTLESRLGESFKQVSERLEAVHKGLGDMQQLATGVGDLKKVLSNVKTRGVMGEYQLENILEQILTPEQYGKNVKTKEGSNALVEFAIKMPGKGEKDKSIWLPIDSKFPKEDFELLIDAYEKGAPELIEEHRKNFVRGIKKCAADISGKYVDPPHTTDFAILFLPFESLYAEVLRTPGLFESIQRECKIIITGPTTLSALLSSLQMGFRTLAIEKRSSEVWEVLGAVKTEFKSFGGILEKTQKKLQEATNNLESVGVRSRAMERKLKTVEEHPTDKTLELLGDNIGIITE
ncbi:DNA recombination protein RmuC [Desertivirga arenae]|uniref:DNA recombination protein RmuC n=1 Tax=Desertivirga arenae TaxID=2810309 RepID=UPI001A9651EE|nr:DNA recombination protein RmuC [Pedobacter sp. SYSU D00823]